MATWPTSVATDALLYIAVNNLQTTLSGSIDNAVTTLTLASSTGFPTAGGVTIDTEVIFYTGISGAQLTGLTRGADGTTAASHSSGVPVGATVIAAHHNLLKNEIIAIESSLNLTASKAVVTNSSGRLVASSVTDAELGYLSGVTSAIQTQLDAKATDSLVVHLAGAESITGAKTFSAATLFSNGTVSLPGIAFGSDPDTGVYHIGTNQIGISAGGSLVLDIASAQIDFSISGSVVAELNSARFRPEIDNALQLGSTTQGWKNIYTGDGTVSLPALSFSADNDSGMYRIGANNIGIAAGGSKVLDLAAGANITSATDFYTIARTDYSGTSTVTGWTSFTTKLIYYKKIGQLVFVWWDLRGTSNGTTVTFTLPYTASNDVSYRVCADTTDNGTRTTTGGEAVLPGNSSTLQVYKDMSQAAWTNSGTKETMGMIFFQSTT